MYNMDESLRNTTYYLIELFYRTEKKYSCSRSKLGKLLSIVAFIYAREDKKLFQEKIYKYPGCGTYIESLQFIVLRDVYYQPNCINDKEPIIHIPLYTQCDVPLVYKCDSYPSVRLCDVIQDVFKKFGSYSTVDLGNCLNPIVELEGITYSDNSINLDKIRQLTLSDFKQTNEVIKYIFS